MIRRSCFTLLIMLFGASWGLPVALAKQEAGVPDRKFQKEIDKAIAKGAKWLRGVQQRSGAFGAVTHRKEAHYEIGTSALAGLALLAAGDKAGDKSVDGVLAQCRKLDKLRGQAGSRTTYDTSTLIMFVVEYYKPKQKKPRGRRGKSVERKAAQNPCELPDDVKAWVRDMATWLASQQKDTGGWGYPIHREDFSNTQYALLGLRAARDCGVKIAPTVFLKTLERALALQETEGPKVPRSLAPDRPGGTIYKINAGDRARGWPYRESEGSATGSMTSAGIAIIAICHDALLKPRRFPPYAKSLQNKAAQAMQDGFAWLETNWTLERNPGANAPNWHFYYLYGLERAGVLGGRNYIGERDWYLLGARYLVDEQAADGRWSTGALGTDEYEASDALDTAWAILFLKRATRPGKPLEPPVVTDTEGGG